jgi:hypothetical protein
MCFYDFKQPFLIIIFYIHIYCHIFTDTTSLQVAEQNKQKQMDVFELREDEM